MAGGNARALKRRIKVVKNTQQITKAMKMVAAAKLKTAQTKIEAAAPYTDMMEKIIGHLLQAAADLKHPLTEPHETTGRIAVIVMTSDRGLCGSYNSNLIRTAQRFINEKQKEGLKVSIYAIGKRGYEFFKKNNYNVVYHHIGLAPTLTFYDAKEIGQNIKSLYADDKCDAVYVCYAMFKNVVSVIPTTFQFLPLAPRQADSEATSSKADYIFEPSAETMYQSLIPRFVDMQVYRLLIESLTSEFAARMTAMTAATDNAAEVIRSLTITYNKVRQSSITAELLDIIGGANALDS